MVEPIRQLLDPRQHAIIAAHVTLCRDEELAAWPEIHERLAHLGAFQLTMQFGDPEVLADGCVLLRPLVGAASYQQLRQSILGPSAPVHGAHITLLHPRHAVGVRYDLAEIGLALSGLTVTFPSVVLIEQDGDGPWLVHRQWTIADG